MISVYVVLAGFLIFLLADTVSCFGSRSAVNIRPPIDNVKSRGKGGENGHRLLTATECSSVVDKWQRKIGIMDSGNKIELFEILSVIEKFSKIMPGREPQSNQLILTFGLFNI